MKYIIDVPNDRAEYYSMNNSLHIPVIVDRSMKTWIDTYIQIEPCTDPDRKAIEDEVWRFLVFLIDEMDSDEKYECFGLSSSYKIVSTMSYLEAKSKYEEWKKQKDEIRVGDEVTPKDGTWRGVVVGVVDGDLTIMGDKGISARGYESKFFSKTGRHFPEVAQLLEKMRGDM